MIKETQCYRDDNVLCYKNDMAKNSKLLRVVHAYAYIENKK